MDQPSPCRICHVEIPAPDLAAAETFYTELFGWEVGGPLGDDYVLMRTPGLGGGLDGNAVPREDGVVLVIEVDDIDVTLEAIEAAGGGMLHPRTQLPDDMGFYAYFRDPCGNRLGLWSRA